MINIYNESNYIIIFRLTFSLIFPTNIVRSMFIMILIIRNGHVSWASPSGTILMGGIGSLRTSEMIDDSHWREETRLPGLCQDLRRAG